VNLAIALMAATVGAAIAVRARQSAIIGYIVAGLAIGPHTPGFVGDIEIVEALADIGVIFLMFAIGVQVSIRDLVRVGPVAGIGGSIQVAVMIGLGYLAGRAMGWGELESFVFGAVISNSSSTILARVLGERGEIESEHAHITLAWSTVQDLGTIILVVLISALATTGEVGGELLVAIGRAIVFLALLLPLGVWLVPRILELLASFRSREVFVAGIVALALGTAYASSLFGISLALGAFLAGLIISESDLSHRVLAETLPFRDLFAGLFFVSIGMLVDPAFVVENLPFALLVVFLIVAVKGLLVGVTTALFRYPARTSILVGVGLAQSAEFSFLLARLGTDLGVVSNAAFSLMLTGAAASIVLSAPLHRAGPHIARRLARRNVEIDAALDGDAQADRRRVAVVIGYGRAGQVISGALQRRGFRLLVLEEDRGLVRDLRKRGITTVRGSPDNRSILEHLPLDQAVVLVIAVQDPITVRQIVANAKELQPRLPIIAQAHSSSERDVLRDLGASAVVVAETEVALEMTRFTLRRLGVSSAETQAIISGLRGDERSLP
jgi:monovalent cation:H+ antiporter-2, CPA2 family